VLTEVELILIGFGVGLIVSAPVGPVNILSIHCTLQRGFLAGVAAGLGAVLADGVLALLAASGVTYISGLMTRYRTNIQLIGGLVVLLFGVRLLLSRPHDQGDGGSRREPDGWIIPKTFVLTMTNPGAVLAMFALVGSATSAAGLIQGARAVGVFVAAVMVGGLIWWLSLASVVARVAHRIDDRRLRLINRIAGFVLVVFGGYLLVEVVARSLMGRGTS